MELAVSFAGEVGAPEPGGDSASVEPGGTDRTAPDGRAGGMYRPPAIAFSIADALSTGSLMALNTLASTGPCTDMQTIKLH